MSHPFDPGLSQLGLRMSQKKTFVCFANSRKEGGRCVVGKEKTDSGYAWIRPVGDRSKGELSNLEIGYDGRVGGAKPKFLDVVEIVVKERKSHEYQKENWLIDNNYCWKKKGECRQDRVRGLVDAPKDRDDVEMTTGIPVTYVPARNTIFLSYALGYAEVIECRDIFIGVNAVDYSGYPDCRPEFIQSFETTANLGTKMGVDGKSAIRIHAPLVNLTKAEIIRRGIELSVDYSLTRTCYDPDEKGSACGRCDACLLRLKGFEDNEMADPAPYQA